jgi:hypothetical protein
MSDSLKRRPLSVAGSELIQLSLLAEPAIRQVKSEQSLPVTLFGLGVLIIPAIVILQATRFKRHWARSLLAFLAIGGVVMAIFSGDLIAVETLQRVIASATSILNVIAVMLLFTNSANEWFSGGPSDETVMTYIALGYFGLTVGVGVVDLFLYTPQGIALLLATPMAFFAGSGMRGTLYGTHQQKILGGIMGSLLIALAIMIVMWAGVQVPFVPLRIQGSMWILLGAVISFLCVTREDAKSFETPRPPSPVNGVEPIPAQGEPPQDEPSLAPPQPRQSPILEAENEALRAFGWHDDDIALMGTKERAAELKDAGYERPKEQG